MPKTVRINFRNLSRICVKADPWAIPTCNLLHGMVSRISTTLVIFMICQLEVESPLSRSTTSTPRIRRHFRFGDLRPILSTLTVVTLRKRRFSVYWNSSDRAFLVKEQSSVFPSALRKNVHEFQKDTYQLGILTLNLGHINRVPYIGGCSKFPKWVRTDMNHRALPHLVFRNAAHIVCLCEASDEYGGIAFHRELAEEYGMIGMVIHPAIQSQSVAIFLRGSHDAGSFIELLCHHQIETGNKSSPFWILHGAIFRLCHGMNTSGEFVDPSTGCACSETGH